MLRFLLVIVSALVSVAALAQVPPKVFPTDSQIEAQVHDRLAKSVVGKDGFTAKVKAGVVYWEGSTTVAQHKGAATRIAKSSGARRVVNNIVVKKGGAKKQAAAPKAPRPATAVPAVSAPAPEPAPPAPARVAVKWRETHP
jgi:hypothetical protein